MTGRARADAVIATIRRHRAASLSIAAAVVIIALGAGVVIGVSSQSSGAPRVAATPHPSASTAPQVIGGDLPLPQKPWWGGPSYYAAFPKAAAAGWTKDGFFPIAVFYGKPSQARELASIGVNTFMGAEHDGSSMSSITKTGMSVIAQDEWTSAEVGDDPRVVGWHASDECDMGYSGCDDRGDSEKARLAVQTSYVDALRGKKDGRFVQANFGNGVLGTYWAPTTMAEQVGLMDVSSVDKYAYTSPHVQDLLVGAPDWIRGLAPKSARAYGWLQDRMADFSDPAASKPNWVFVETAKPNLTEGGATTITTDQIGGAVWNAIIHGAAGIAYFQHNNDGCGTYSLVDCSADLRSAVRELDAEVADLAPVINSPSYEWDFGSGVDTALKAKDGSAYVFAMPTGHPGSRTLDLPPGVDGRTVEVVGENRTIPVRNGRFSDDFAAEYSHHIYRIALDG